jgi:hypothetical protein
VTQLWQASRVNTRGGMVWSEIPGPVKVCESVVRGNGREVPILVEGTGACLAARRAFMATRTSSISLSRSSQGMGVG